jgi:hypothetical protein
VSPLYLDKFEAVFAAVTPVAKVILSPIVVEPPKK